jgi:hypothetical protein
MMDESSADVVSEIDVMLLHALPPVVGAVR